MNWLWLGLSLGIAALEVLALLNRRDKFQPATYWIRRVLFLHDRYQPLYWIGLGFWLWLGIHFFLRST